MRSRYKVTCDVGGTFTDVVVADLDSIVSIGKAPTRRETVQGVIEALEFAAFPLGISADEVLTDTTLFMYSTTTATNAVLERKTATTALLVTRGFPDILVLREGGHPNGFDRRIPYPEPYVPRSLTFEIPERIDSEGIVVVPLDEAAVRTMLRGLPRRGVEAIAVCLLWSIVNPAHEDRIAALVEEILPGIPCSVSHRLNPVIREFRRASATTIDASLKPLMGSHFDHIAAGLRERSFSGEFMVATSQGGVTHADDIRERPIDTVRSGPALAPVAGIHYSKAVAGGRDLIVCDAGGTSFDVSLVRDGQISYTRETWLGGQFLGHLTGRSSVDVRSIGSGGGSIAWVDPGGLLRVGPRSAGAQPGPVCYGLGGKEVTVTDAALCLGLVNPQTLGGNLRLNATPARRAMAALAAELSLAPDAAAYSILAIANENMARAIHDLTVKIGLDPRDCLIVAGGGSAGLSVASMVRELGGHDVLIPRTAGAFSAAGAQFSDVICEFTASGYADTGAIDSDGINAVLDRLDLLAADYQTNLFRRGLNDIRLERFVEARYVHQVWELEVPLPFDRIRSEADIAALSSAFDKMHLQVFAVADDGARVECLTWKTRLRAKVTDALSEVDHLALSEGSPAPRPAYMDGAWHNAAVYAGGSISLDAPVEGPAIIEEPTSTIVVPPGARASLTHLNSYYLEV